MQIRPQALACALALCSNAGAVEPPPTPSVEVRGARYDERREETAASLVVNREELQRHGDRSLGEALKRVPGITIGDGGGRGSDIRLRGLGNGYTRVLLNGVPAPAGFSLDSLAPELVERVEIVRSASAELGTQAIAGIVNIVLRKVPARATSTFKAGVDRQRGQYTGTLTGETSAKDGDFSYALPVTLFKMRLLPSRIEDETAAGLDRRTWINELDQRLVLSMSPRANWVLANGDAINLLGFASATRGSVAADVDEVTYTGSPTRYPGRAGVFQVEAALGRVDLGWTHGAAATGRLEVKAGADRLRRHGDFDFSPVSAGVRQAPVHFVTADFREGGERLGATYALPPAGGHQISFGMDGAHTRRSQTRVGRETDTADGVPALHDDAYVGTIERIGAFAQDGWEITPAWSLSAGVRIETLSTTVADRNAPTVSQRSKIVSPILQALYKAGADSKVRVGLARTYKAPQMVNLIPRRYTVDNNNSATNPDNEGNPALKPEKAWGLDLGYDRYVGKDGLYAVSAYWRRIEDVTGSRLFLDGASWVSSPVNQGRASTRGVSLEAKSPVPGIAGLSMNGNLARNWSVVDAVPGPDNRIEGQAPLTANLGLDYRAYISVGANFNYARAYKERHSPQWRGANGGSRGLDVYALWGAGSATRVRVSGNNLLRRDSVTASVYDEGAALRQTVTRINTGAMLRITLEHDFKTAR